MEHQAACFLQWAVLCPWLAASLLFLLLLHLHFLFCTLAAVTWVLWPTECFVQTKLSFTGMILSIAVLKSQPALGSTEAFPWTPGLWLQHRSEKLFQMHTCLGWKLSRGAYDRLHKNIARKFRGSWICCMPYLHQEMIHLCYLSIWAKICHFSSYQLHCFVLAPQ